MNIKDLIGKTIIGADYYGYKGYNDIPFIKLTFSDETIAIIRASYGGYNGGSVDEYPSYIDVCDDFFEEYDDDDLEIEIKP
jgi:hypothetical protein